MNAMMMTPPSSGYDIFNKPLQAAASNPANRFQSLLQGVQQQQQAPMPMPQMPMPFVPPTPMPFMQQQQRTMQAPNFSVMNGQIAPPDPTMMMPSMKGLFGGI